MKQILRNFRYSVFFILFVIGIKGAHAQTGVLNPNDPLVIYNPNNPPATPSWNTLAKWVAKGGNAKYKAYYFNGIPFRLKFPKSYSAAADGKKYPLYMFFGGRGTPGTIYDNDAMGGSNYHEPVTERGEFDGFLLYPQSTSPNRYFNETHFASLRDLIVNYLIPEAKVDPDKVIVNGLSAGGSATWSFTMAHPKLVAAAIPMCAVSLYHINALPDLTYKSIWISSGALDNNPHPNTVRQLMSAAEANGNNLHWTYYTTLAHNVWDSVWKERDYFPYLNRAHRANPWARYGRTEFCPGDNINVTLGVQPGLDGYQWRKNGQIISGATGNTISVTTVGVYDCRILTGSTWGSWSTVPVEIKIKQPTVSPNIAVDSLSSRVLPAPDGSTTVNLKVPANYVAYEWQKLNPTTTLPSTTNVMAGATVGDYQVKVTERYGCSSSFSQTFTVINANGPNPPNKPLSLQATATSQTQVSLTWNINQGTYAATQFEIYQSVNAEGNYKLAGFAAGNASSAVISGLDAGTRYYYKIRAINNTAASATSDVASSVTPSDVTPPTAPNNLRLGATGHSMIELLWEPSVDNVGVTYYEVYINGKLSYTVPGDQESFEVNNLANGQFYQFLVKAKDETGNISAPSNQMVASPAFSGLAYKYYTTTGTWTKIPNFATLTPKYTGDVPNVTLSSRDQNDRFAFLWEGYIDIRVAGSYTFRTHSDEGSKLYLGARNQVTSPYNHSATALVNNDGQHTAQSKDGTITLQAGIYPIAITYFENTGSEVMNISWKTPATGGQFVAIPNTAFVQAVTNTGAVPAAPANLTATALSSRRIKLNWQDNSNNETGFEIYRSNSSTGDYAIVKTVTANNVTFTDSLLEPSTTYYYRIKSVGQHGASAYTATVSAATQALPAQPTAATGLAGTAQDTKTISLNWNNGAGVLDGVEIWRSPLNTANYELVKFVSGSIASYADTAGLTAGTIYFYKVKKVNEAGTSGFSNEISVATAANPASTVAFNAPANASLYNDTVVVVALSATTNPGTTVTFTSDNLPGFATIASSGNTTALLTLNPGERDLGTYNINIKATNNFEASVSRVFTVTVDGKKQKGININFNAANPQAAPWNNTNKAANALINYQMNNLTYTDGSVSGIGLLTLHNWVYANSNGAVTGNNSGVFPDNVLRTAYSTTAGSPTQFKITSLAANKKYSVVFFGGYSWTAQQQSSSGTIISNYSIGAQSVTLNNMNNTNNTVRINGVSPDADGSITVSVQKAPGSFGAALNAIQVFEYDGPAVSSLSAPADLTANGTSANQIRLDWTSLPQPRTGFEVWRSTAAGGVYNLIGTVAANVTGYTNTGLSANTTYYYKVRAVNGAVYSDYSLVAGASTVAYTVNLQLNSATNNSVNNPVWNSTNTALYEGFVLSNLTNTLTQGTGISFVAGAPFNNVTTSFGTTTGNNSGPVPDAVMKTNYYIGFAATADFSFVNLNHDYVYNLTFFAGTSYAGSGNTIYSVGNKSVSINPVNNTANTVTLYGVKPDETGTIKVRVYSSSGYGWLNSVSIHAMKAPDMGGVNGGVAGLRRRPEEEVKTAVSADPDVTITKLVGYPNPFVDNITLQMVLKKNVPKLAIMVTDMSGKPVYRAEYTDVRAGIWQQSLNLGSRMQHPGTLIVYVSGMPGEAPKTFKITRLK